MARRRSHSDACALSHALELVGERWALLIVRELLLGPKRFTDLRTAIPDLSANILSHRLRELEHTGVVARGKLPPPAAARVYGLTGWGRELEPAVVALGRWGSRSPAHNGDGDLSVDAMMIALKSDFDPDAARDLSMSVELCLGDERFHVEVGGGELRIGRGRALDPDASIETDTATLSGLLFAGRELGKEIRAGTIAIEGPRAVVTRFLGLFPPPIPAPPAAVESISRAG
jgi:DNA-binding HxlR family transcriptional regulator